MRAQILKPTPENIRRAAESLRAGGIGGMPTETVYGLAGVAFNATALAKIFDTKERPHFDPLIVHVAPEAKSLALLANLKLVDLSRLSAPMQALAEKLIATYWPGPLTLVLPKLASVPDLATSGLPSVGVRMPAHPVGQALLREAGPLAAPSANRFGRISPTRASHVMDELGDRIEWILDGGSCDVGVESTVLSLTEDAPTLLRPGGVSREQIEKTGSVSVRLPSKSSKLEGPGMLESHYAPSKPLHLASGDLLDFLTSGDLMKRILTQPPLSTTIGCILMKGDADEFARRASAACSCKVIARSLSSQPDAKVSNLTEAAQNLFAAMRELDASPAQILFSELPTGDTGLAHAIRDRLQRAAAKRP